MAFAATTGRPAIEIETPQPRDFLLSESNNARPSLEPESITDLAGQWRQAYAIAEAQERRLVAVQAAAAKLCSSGRPEGSDGEFLPHQTHEAHNSWCRQAEAIDASLGLPALEQTANYAWVVADRVAERLLGLRPMNVQEAAVKFGVLMTIIQADNYEIDEPDRLHRFLEDLAQLAAAGSH